MSGRRLRSFLEPVLYVGIAALVHSALFLIPGGEPARKEKSTTQRGVKVRAFVERPKPPSPVAANVPAPSAPPPPTHRQSAPEQPLVAMEKNYSVMGSRDANGDSMTANVPSGGAKGTGSSRVEAGGGGGAQPQGAKAQEGGTPQSEFGKYLASIKSSNVQGWAKESALKSRQGWKGIGTGSGAGAGSGSGDGWGSGSGSGGRGGSGSGPGGSGLGKTGSGTGGNGALYMDPRVKIVVTSYPPTSIERRYAPIPYPNLKFKQTKFTSGWWNVYIKLRVDSAGNPGAMEVLRPETDGALERQFVDQVKREVAKWSFDPKEAEIHIDVRFYVE